MIIPPRQLHLPLGQMALSTSLHPPNPPRKTLEEAKAFLTSLHPQIVSLLRTSPESDETAELVVPLQRIDILPPDGSKKYILGQVLYVAPLPPKLKGSARVPALAEVVRVTKVCGASLLFLFVRPSSLFP